MAFRKKFYEIIKLKPDVLVLQEVEHKSKLITALKEIDYHQIEWFGKNKNKGVAVITFQDYDIKLNSMYNPKFEYILPLILSIDNFIVNLFNIWAMPHKTDKTKSYIGQVFRAVNFYKSILDKPSILIGDFNSNAIWDNKKRVGTHTDVVTILNQKKIYSLYHLINNCNHGKEKDNTFFLLKNETKPFHIDYCFASEKLITEQTKIEIGRYNDWIKLSDHMPIIIDKLRMK